MRRSGPRLRLVADDSRPIPEGRRATERERRDAAALLRRAFHEGRFGSSDLYERRLEAIGAATSLEALASLVADLDDLVPESVRAQVLELLCTARADGRLAMEEFDERTGRCLGALRAADADVLVRDIGHRIVRDEGVTVSSRAARLARTVARSRAASTLAAAAGIGALAGGLVVVVPAGLSVPGGAGQWLPLAFACGAFSAVAAALCAVAWKVRLARGGTPFPVWHRTAGPSFPPHEPFTSVARLSGGPSSGSAAGERRTPAGGSSAGSGGERPEG